MWEIKKFCKLGVLFVLIVSSILASPVKAQSGGVLYFEETGHSISGVILDYYQGVEDAALLFGFPITEEWIDEQSGGRTQYFQHARLDIVGTKGAQRVEIAPLGSLLYDPSAPATPLNTGSAACRTSGKMGKPICYDFLRFYEAHNGAQYLGEPISLLIEQEGRIVQYFEKGRLEWRPELPAGQKIGVSSLGKIYYDQKIGREGQFPSGPNIMLSALPEVKVNTFVAKALIPAHSTQKIFVIVQDKNLQPVQGAMVEIAIHKPGELGVGYRAPATDADGISVFEFAVGELPVRQVMNVDVEVNYAGQATPSQSWFRVWW